MLSSMKIHVVIYVDRCFFIYFILVWCFNKKWLFLMLNRKVKGESWIIEEALISDKSRKVFKPDYEDDDKIIFCDGCNTGVHQSCYGLDCVPAGEWICQKCSLLGFGVCFCFWHIFLILMCMNKSILCSWENRETMTSEIWQLRIMELFWELEATKDRVVENFIGNCFHQIINSMFSARHCLFVVLIV